jgi:hypothetical protein
MAYLYVAVRDPFAFAHVQAGWFRTAQLPWESVWRALTVAHRLPLVTNQNNLVELGAVLFVAVLLGLSFAGPWRLRRDQWAIPLFGVLVLLLVICYPTTKDFQPLMSAGRILLEAFPAFLVLGRLGERELLDRTYTFAGIGIQSALLIHFLHGGWVA